MTIADLIALQGLFVAVIGGALGLLWAEVNKLRRWRHDVVAEELQIIIAVLENNGMKVPERRGGNE